MDSLDTSLVCIIRACAMLCNIIALLGKTDMHKDQRLATGVFFIAFMLYLGYTVRYLYSYKEKSRLVLGEKICLIL